MLVGLSDLLVDCWEPPHQELFEQVWPYAAGWLKRALADSNVVGTLCALTRQPVAAARLVEIIDLFVQTLVERGDAWLDEHGVEDRVARLLVFLYETFPARTRPTGDIGEGFEALLSELVVRQNPIALQLQEQRGRL